MSNLWTWGRLIQAFTTTYLVDKAPNTRRSYESTFRAVVGQFGESNLPHKASLYGWLAERVNTGQLTASSANTMRGHLHQLFTVIRDHHGAQVLNVASFPRFQSATPRGSARP